MKTLPGINIQTPWAEKIVSGAKTVETRLYPLPPKYIGRTLVVIRTPGEIGTLEAKAIGLVVFDRPFLYPDEQTFNKDSPRHLIGIDDLEFSWAHLRGQQRWGWPITWAKSVEWDLPKDIRRGIKFSSAIPLPQDVPFFD